MKSAKELCHILEPEKTFSSSSPFIHSLFNMYLYLEAINVLLKYKPIYKPIYKPVYKPIYKPEPVSN